MTGKVLIVRLNAVAGATQKSYESHTTEKSFSGIVEKNVAMRTDDEVDMGCKVSWNKSIDTRILAIPSGNGSCMLCVKGDAESDWTEVNLCSGDPLSHGDSNLNLAVFSPDGKHLATADVSGKVVLWEMNMKDLKNSNAVRVYTPDSDAKPLLDMAWGQEDGDNYLVISTKSSTTKLDAVIPSPQQPLAAVTTATAAPTATEAMDIDEEEEEEALMLAAVEEVEATVARRLIKASTANDDDEEEDDIFADSAPGSATNGLVTGIASSAAADDSLNAIKIATLDKNVVRGDDDEDLMQEDGDIQREWSEAKAVPTVSDIDARVLALEEVKNNSMVEIQEPFQSSSTQPDDKHRRYLVWNSIGNITLREEADINQNRIEIRFADTQGRNKQEAFADTDGFVMAALGKEGAIFATPLEPVEDDDRVPKGSKVHYHAFPGHAKMGGTNETFTVDLLENEEATNVAVGTGWCAVATTKGLVRIFSSTGVQTNVFWIKGPIVTMIGSGTQLSVFYNASQPVNGTMNIKMDSFAVFWDTPKANRCTLSDVQVPLSAQSSLEWVGYEADSQCVCILDSAGMLSILMNSMGWQWLPALDVERVKKSPDHTFWPIAVRKDKFAYVLLNGESRPAIYPQPVVTTKPLRIPVADEKGEAANQRSHDLLWACTLTAHLEMTKTNEDVFGLIPVEAEASSNMLEERFQKQQVEADKTVLKMFQDACRTHQLAKAIDLAYMLRTEKAMYAGTQIANKFGRPTVATKLDELIERKMEEKELLEQQQMHEEPAPVPIAYTSTPSHALGPQGDDGYTSASDVAYVEVGPADTTASENDSNAVTPAEARPHNPFKKSHHSPVKRKAGEYDMEDLKKMKASPSPMKKALLSRQSSFTETARAHRPSLNSI